MGIEYCDNGQFVYAPLWWHRQGLSQTASGYGAQLTTPWKTEYQGKLYRVYQTCYSNAASSWIVVRGQRLHLSNTTLPE